MRPERFADALLEWICGDQQVRAVSFATAGYPHCPWGVVVELPTGAQFCIQVTGFYLPSEYPGYAEPPVMGAVLAAGKPVQLPEEGRTRVDLLETWLAWRITQAGSAEIASVELFQDRPPNVHKIPFGIAVKFYTGAECWAYFRHVTPAGRELGSGAAWRAQATV